MRLPELESWMEEKDYFRALCNEGAGLNEARKISRRAVGIRRVRQAQNFEELRDAVADVLGMLQ
jgi:hypothetical protein